MISVEPNTALISGNQLSTSPSSIKTLVSDREMMAPHSKSCSISPYEGLDVQHDFDNSIAVKEGSKIKRSHNNYNGAGPSGEGSSDDVPKMKGCLAHCSLGVYQLFGSKVMFVASNDGGLVLKVNANQPLHFFVVVGYIGLIPSIRALTSHQWYLTLQSLIHGQWLLTWALAVLSLPKSKHKSSGRTTVH